VADLDDLLVKTSRTFALIARPGSRCAEGMARFVSPTDVHGQLQFANLDELRRHRYVIAGIVGEMLDVVERDGPGAKLSRARVFGIRTELKGALRRGRPAVETPTPASVEGA
jgi:phytoene/squalene synthetase